MKIAICSDAYYPMTNGVAVFTTNLAKGLRQLGHDVIVISPSFTGKRHTRTDKTGVVNHFLTAKRFYLYPDQIHDIPDKKEVLGLKMPRLVYKNGLWLSTKPRREIKKILKNFKPDIIHLQTAGPVGLGVMSYVKKTNTPLISTGHSYPDNFTSQFKLLRPIKRPVNSVVRHYLNSFLKDAEYATMPTELAIEELIPKNRKHFKVPVEALSNGVDLSAFKPGKPSKKIREKYRLDENPHRIIYIGRIDPEKSIDIVIKAFKEVSEKIPDAEFILIGDGADKARLEKLTEHLELEDKVRFLGRILPPDLYELYRTGAVFATASETETQGIVLIEAAATGLPLVAVDAGAIKEICKNGKNGYLCKPEDIDGIAKSLIKILSDPKKQKEMSKASLEIAKEHDLNRTLKRFEEIYCDIIESHGKAEKTN
ncbi:MAG: glycosyltransferase [Candidatus Saccharibacteria bacterium]|nr:glycosyltransferase [Candidatus Saccharibacteria bacterium]